MSTKNLKNDFWKVKEVHNMCKLSDLKFRSNKGFTLSETLITLGIIGVVSAITIPSLVNNIQDKHFKALWKKTFAQISSAYENAFAENPINHPLTGPDTIVKPYSTEIYYQILSRLSEDYCVVDGTQGKICANGFGNRENVSPDCKSFNPNEDKKWCMYAGGGGYAQLNSGVRIYAQSYIWTHPSFLVDVNGTKGPNIVGRDMFIVLFRGNKVIPGGAQGYELKGCDKSAESDAGACGPGGMAGSGCGAKYLYE